MVVTKHSPNIWTIDNFLSPSECESLILFSEQRGYQEATVSLPEGAKMIKGIRNNYRLLYQDAQLAQKYWERLLAHCPAQIGEVVATGLNDQFRLYKYADNQRFKRHIDGRFRKSGQEESRITFMVYLNDDFTGGETKFDQVTIQPKAGTALCFIHELKHEGCPVPTGTKYVIRTDVMYYMPS